MDDVLGWSALVAIYGAVMGWIWLSVRRSSREAEGRQAAWAAEHVEQTAELARQRRLRELEEYRRGFLRGRERSCRFCGVEQGCLTQDDVCLDVEACLGRAGVPVAESTVAS